MDDLISRQAMLDGIDKLIKIILIGQWCFTRQGKWQRICRPHSQKRTVRKFRTTGFRAVSGCQKRAESIWLRYLMELAKEQRPHLTIDGRSRGRLQAEWLIGKSLHGANYRNRIKDKE